MTSNPQTMQTTPAGLYVPNGTPIPLAGENNQLLSLEERLDINSLQASLVEIYLRKAKVEEKGVIKYKELTEQADIQALAGEVMSALRDHINYRHYGLTPELLAQLNAVKGPSGEVYSDVVVRNFIPQVTEKGLETAFTKSKVSLGVMENLGKQLGQIYSQRCHVLTLENLFGNDKQKMAQGLLNLNSNLRISKEINEGNLAQMDIQDLTEAYIKAVYEGRTKQGF